MSSSKRVGRTPLCLLFSLLIVLLQVAPSRAEEITTTPLQFYGLGTLTCAAWSPDGTQIVTGGSAGAFLWDVATSRVIRMFISHTREVVAVAISANGSKVLTGSADGTARVWNVAEERTIQTFTGYNGRPNSLGFNPLGTQVLLAESDRKARLRNISDGSIARTFSGHTGDILCATLSADGTRVVSGAKDNTARIWDAGTGAFIRNLNCGGWVKSVALSPDRSKVLTLTNVATLWDTANGATVWTTSWPGGLDSLAFSSDSAQTAMGTHDGLVIVRDSVATSVARGGWFAGDAPVVTVAYSPDRARLLAAVATPVNTPRIWTTANLPFDGIFGHGGWVTSVAFSPEGTRVLTGSSNDTAKLWNAADGALIRTFSGHGLNVTSVAFSPDGTKVLTGGTRFVPVIAGEAKLSNAADGSLISTFSGHSQGVTSVAFSPDGDKVLTGSGDQTARLWNATNGSVIRTFSGHTAVVQSVAFSPDGAKVLTGALDGTARLWNATTGSVIRTFLAGNVYSAIFSPNRTEVLTGSDDRTAKLWNPADGNLLHTFSGHTNEVLSVAFSPDGTKVLTGSADRTAKLWNVADSSLIRTFSGHGSNVTSVAFSPDGTKVLTGSGDGSARLWELTPGGSALVGHNPDLTAVAISDDATTIATGHDDGTIRLWGAVTGKALRILSGHTSGVRCLDFAPAGPLLLSGSNDRKARLWNTATGQLMREFSGHTSSISSVAFSSDAGKVLTASGDDTAILWDTTTGTPIRAFSGHGGAVYAAAISSDDGFVLTGGSDRTAKLWNADTGTLVRTFSGHSGPVRAVAFSSTGSLVLTGSDDMTARLWSVTTGGLIRTFSGHTSPVLAVAFAPNDNQIMTAGDTTTKIWKVSDGTLVETIQHRQPVAGAALSSDGTRIVTGSEDAVARLWSAFPGQGGRVSTGDKFLLVAGGGDYPGNPIVSQTKALADRVLFTCRMRGYRRNEIRYLSAFDGLPDADAQATTETFWSAIDEWSSGTARLFIYLVDHGSWNSFTNQWYFRLNQNDYISARDLDAHLDALQTATNCEVILIVDYCYSGGFVQQCVAPAGVRRIVISSTTPTNLSIYTPPAGALSFSFFFFSFAIMGNTMDNCFEWTRLAFQSMGNPAGQRPWMDDDNDGDSDKWDGALAARHVLGRYPAFGLNAPTITDVAATQTVEVGQPALLWARLNEAVPAREVWALVIPEGQSYEPGRPVTNLRRVDLASSPTANRWEARFAPTGQFAGRCSVIYFAMSEDALRTQLLATPVASGLLVEGDRYEVDDTATSATEYIFSATPMYDDRQVHNFHDAGDVDWIWFYGTGGLPYTLHVLNPGPNCDPVIAVYDSTTATAPVSQPVDNHGPGQEETWTTLSLTRTGVYYLKLFNANSSLYGAGTSYTLWLTEDTGANIGLAIALGSRSGHLTWDQNPEPSSRRYNVYRMAVGETNWTLVNPAPLLTEECNDTGLQPSTGYFYRVTIVPASGPEGHWRGVSFGVTLPDTGCTVGFDAATTTVSEAAGTVPVRLRLSAPSSQQATVSYSARGTATGGGMDYNMPPGPVIFGPGETTKNIPVTIVDDPYHEPPETVIVALTGATGATIGGVTTHTLTILDNDPPPAVGFERTAQSVAENGTSVSARVVLSAVSATTVTVSYSTANGTAAAGSDYMTTAGTLTFAPGQTAKFIRVRILNDLIYGRDETFSIRLSGAANATISTGTQVVTIRETDPRPQVQFVLAASSANENAGRVPIWVGLTRPSASGASVRYAVTGGTATRGQDYSIATGTLVFRRNAVATSITVNVLEDARDEYNETVILSLSNPTTATLGSPATHTFTIGDNDPPPPVGFARAASSVPETIGVARVPVLLTPPSEKTVTVNYATANGTALAGRDYRTSSGILTFGPLHTTATANVRILATHQRGTHKTLQLTLTNPQNATLGTTRTHTLTILGETAIRRWPLYR